MSVGGLTKAENGLGITESEEAHADCAMETQVALYLACLFAFAERTERLQEVWERVKAGRLVYWGREE